MIYRLNLSNYWSAPRGMREWAIEVKKPKKLLSVIRCFEGWAAYLPFNSQVRDAIQAGRDSLKDAAFPLVIPFFLLKTFDFFESGMEAVKTGVFSRRFFKSGLCILITASKVLRWGNRIQPLQALQLSKAVVKTAAKVGAIGSILLSSIRICESVHTLYSLRHVNPCTDWDQRSVGRNRALAGVDLIASFLHLATATALLLSLFFSFFFPPVILLAIVTASIATKQIVRGYFQKSRGLENSFFKPSLYSTHL